MRQKSYFQKLLLTYIIPGIFFISVTGGVFGYSYMSSMKRELGIQAQMYLGQVAQDIDYNVESFQSVADRLKMQDFFQDLVSESSNPYRTAINTIDYLNSLLLNDSVEGKFAVATQELPFVITQTGTIAMPAFVEKMGLDEKQINEIHQMLETPKQYPFTMINPQETASAAGQVLFIQKEEAVPGKYVLFLYLFPQQELLPERVGYMSATTIIGRKDRENWPEQIQEETTSDEVDALWLSGKNEIGSFRTKSNWIYIKTLNYLPGYAAMVQVNDKNIRDGLASMLLFTISICLALLIAFVLFAYWMSKWMYKPVNMITQMFYDIVNGNNKKETDDEFDYIHKMSKNIQKMLTEQRTTLRSKFLHDMLYGIVDNEEIETNINQYGLSAYQEKPCMVGIVMLANEAELETSYTQDNVASIKNQTVRLFLEALGREIDSEYVQMDAAMYAIIMQSADLTDISRRIEEIFDDINSEYGVRLVCFLGKPVDAFHDIHTSYESAMRVQSFFINDSEKVVYLPEDLRDNESVYYYPIDIERNLIHAVVHQNRKDMEFILSYIIQENFVKRNLSSESLKEFLFSFGGTINRILHAMNKRVEDIFEEGTIFYLEFKMCDTSEDIKAKIEEIFDRIYRAGASETEFSGSFQEQVLAFMEENYTKDVSLADIAAHFGLSESHMSKKFKSCMGDTFKNAFNIFRVEKAKEILMENPDIPIYQLSEELGFTNSNSFIRTFKRHTGISPAKYRSE